MKRLFLIRPLLWAGLLGLVFSGLVASCARKEEGWKTTAANVTEIARKNNLSGNRFRVSGTVLGDGVCACIKVCDSNGKCTACVCDPGCSASCD